MLSLSAIAMSAGLLACLSAGVWYVLARKRGNSSFGPAIPQKPDAHDRSNELLLCWAKLEAATRGSHDAAVALDTLRDEIGKVLMPLEMPQPTQKGAKR